MEHCIAGIEKDSIAAELGIEPGDTLISINSRPVRDILEFKGYMAEEKLLLLVKKEDGLYEYDVEKNAGEELGLKFDRATMDEIKSCRNKCIFCFIDQQPKGLRKTLYLKDDDYRLSLLHGNYISLTNLSQADLKRIVAEQISPLYISIHTTNPKLRQQMMHNPQARHILPTLKALKAGGIHFHGQIVLCPGVNDGKALDDTLKDLSKLSPNLVSLSLVPVGITGHRKSLYPLRSFTSRESRQVVEQCDAWQDHFRKTRGIGLVYASDEFYLSAGIPIPPAESYDGYPQLENGVGLVRLLMDDYAESKRRLPLSLPAQRTISIACGLSAKEALKPVVADLQAIGNLQVNLFPIENRFFGGGVTVTGLLTGSDLIGSLKPAPLGDELFLSQVMLKDGGELFLDGLRVKDVQKALKTKVSPVEDVCQFIDRIAGLGPVNIEDGGA